MTKRGKIYQAQAYAEFHSVAALSAR